jgi:hypothetical protein
MRRCPAARLPAVRQVRLQWTALKWNVNCATRSFSLCKEKNACGQTIWDGAFLLPFEKYNFPPRSKNLRRLNCRPMHQNKTTPRCLGANSWFYNLEMQWSGDFSSLNMNEWNSFPTAHPALWFGVWAGQLGSWICTVHIVLLSSWVPELLSRQSCATKLIVTSHYCATCFVHSDCDKSQKKEKWVHIRRFLKKLRALITIQLNQIA